MNVGDLQIRPTFFLRKFIAFGRTGKKIVHRKRQSGFRFVSLSPTQVIYFLSVFLDLFFYILTQIENDFASII